MEKSSKKCERVINKAATNRQYHTSFLNAGREESSLANEKRITHTNECAQAGKEKRMQMAD